MEFLILFGALLAISVTVLLGLSVYSTNPHRLQNALFAVLTTAFVVWLVGSTMIRFSSDPFAYAFWLKYSYLGFIFIAAIFLHFALSFSLTVIPLHIYVPAIFFSLLVLRTDLLISGIIPVGSAYLISYGPAGLYFLLYLLFYMAAGAYQLLRVEHEVSKVNRVRMNFVVFGIGLPFSFGLLLEVVAPYFGFPLFSVIEYLSIPMALAVFYAFFGIEKEHK